MRDATPARPGSFCWPELAAHDAAGARAFYGNLFGWTCRDAHEAPGWAHGVFARAGREAAALASASFGERDAPARWNSYVAVVDVAAAVAKAQALGAAVLRGPLESGTSGRVAVVQDPQGASLGLWEAKGHAGIGIEGEVGSLCWTELETSHVAAATRFYVHLLGWTVKANGDYTEVAAAGTFVGGIYTKGPGREPSPAVWRPYFRVADCDETAADAKGLGGRLLSGPSDLPHLGRSALLADPEGATFAVISFAEVA